MALKRPVIEPFKSEVDGRWYFHVQSRNGEIVAVSSEGYDDEYDALRACHDARRTMRFAKIAKPRAGTD